MENIENKIQSDAQGKFIKAVRNIKGQSEPDDNQPEEPNVAEVEQNNGAVQENPLLVKGFSTDPLILKDLFVESEHWKSDMCLVVVMEELGELIQVLSKNIRGKGNYEHTCEELCDVILGVGIAINRLDIKKEDLQKMLHYKINRTNSRLQNNTY
jgi:NTP pyrophosphatase (non-canonical NTP hydrolase)